MRFVLLVGFIQISLAACAAAQSPVIPPPLPAEQAERLADLPPQTQIYEQFRYWIGFQPSSIQGEGLRHYDAYLASLGVPADDRAHQLEVIESEGRRLEVERW